MSCLWRTAIDHSIKELTSFMNELHAIFSIHKTATRSFYSLPLESNSLITTWAGRVPSVINKFPGFFYSMAFFAPFSTGVGSYQKICYKKIMSLENSTLKDAAMGIEKAYQTNKSRRVPEGHYNRPKRPSNPPPDSSPSVPRQHTQEAAAPQSELDDQGPAINVGGYSQDRSMLETKGDEQEQPNAFSGKEPAEFPNAPQEPKKRGRTFDDIREENRLRNSQQRYPTSRQSGSSTGDERKRRNKYGDVIEP